MDKISNYTPEGIPNGLARLWKSKRWFIIEINWLIMVQSSIVELAWSNDYSHITDYWIKNSKFKNIFVKLPRFCTALKSQRTIAIHCNFQTIIRASFERQSHARDCTTIFHDFKFSIENFWCKISLNLIIGSNIISRPSKITRNHRLRPYSGLCMWANPVQSTPLN